MPDFVGQTVDQAEAILKPLNVRIKTVNLISTEPVGTITAQDPVAGADFALSVTLTISAAPAVVPDVTSQTYGAAEAALTKLGFTVKENPVFDDNRADGLVIEQNPAAGSGNASEVTLNVVRRPVVTYLSEMPILSTSKLLDIKGGIQKSNGKNYSHGLLVAKAQYQSGASGSFEYDFSRQYRQLTGELGLEDKSSSDATAKIEVYGDGRLLNEQTITFGTTTPVEIDVTDILRIRISVSFVDGTGSIVFGDFRAQGLESEVAPTPTSGAPATTR
jgi:serine/threonine-protein kinase